MDADERQTMVRNRFGKKVLNWVPFWRRRNICAVMDAGTRRVANIQVFTINALLKRWNRWDIRQRRCTVRYNGGDLSQVPAGVRVHGGRAHSGWNRWVGGTGYTSVDRCHGRH